MCITLKRIQLIRFDDDSLFPGNLCSVTAFHIFNCSQTGHCISYFTSSLVEMTDKEGYEPIPDVEKGEGAVPEAAAENYADLELNDKETKLLLDLDSAIDIAELAFSVPKVEPSQLASDGQSFIMALVTPTLAAAAIFLAALYLGESGKEEAAEIAEVLIQYFPYLCATAMFISSVSPIQRRLMSAIEPVFTKIDSGKDEIEKAVGNIGPAVDSTIGALRLQVNEVMAPKKPTLDKAKTLSEKIKRTDPSLDIPDLAGIDKEFDEAHGVIGERIKEAQKHLQFDQYIPGQLKSAHAYYWRVVFPIVLLVLAIQLAFATVWEYSSLASTTHSRALSSVELIDGVSEDFREFGDSINEDFEQYEGQFSAAMDESTSLVTNVLWAYVIAFLQLAVVFLLSTNLGRAGLINKTMGTLEDETMRTLRKYGVSVSISDVLGTKMGRVRKNVLKVLKDYKEIDRIVRGLGAAAETAPLKPKVAVAGLTVETGSGDAKGNDKGRSRSGIFGFGKNRSPKKKK
jgi:hypothetical protein